MFLFNIKCVARIQNIQRSFLPFPIISRRRRSTFKDIRCFDKPSFPHLSINSFRVQLNDIYPGLPQVRFHPTPDDILRAHETGLTIYNVGAFIITGMMFGKHLSDVLGL